MLSASQRAQKYGTTYPPNHPGHLKERFGFFREDDTPAQGQPELVGLRSAHGQVVKTWDAVYSLIDGLSRDTSQTEGAKVKAIAKEAKAAADKARKAAEGSINSAMDAAAKLRTELRLSMRPVGSDAGMDAEVRAHLRTLPQAEAYALIVAAMDDYTDDGTAVLRAAGAGPAFLAGLTPQAHAQARERFWQRVKPNEFKAVQQYEDAIAKTRKAVKALDEHVNDWVDWDTAAKLNALNVKPLEVA